MLVENLAETNSVNSSHVPLPFYGWKKSGRRKVNVTELLLFSEKFWNEEKLFFFIKLKLACKKLFFQLYTVENWMLTLLWSCVSWGWRINRAKIGTSKYAGNFNNLIEFTLY